ncbi:hypothetical protein HPB47_008667 [Ixodes persulcatus]|uniref:Uncharacterized protein n=1 Tax=Ixodes persulcatus TaxID=34615 RepID=A0AC60P4D0_IXOPE|nr:hypothetical protein HPB47_008667 [Ixodes persulcatus]
MVADQSAEHNLVVSKDGSPTFFPPPCTFSAIDFTAHSPEIPLSRRVAADTMGSEHFPVFIDIIGLQRPGVYEASVIHWDRFRDNLVRSTRPLLEAISDAAKKATIKATVPTSFPAPDLTLQSLLQRDGGSSDFCNTLFNKIDADLRRYANKCCKRQWDSICSSVDATTPARRIRRLMDSQSGKRRFSLPLASLALCTWKLLTTLTEDSICLCQRQTCRGPIVLPASVPNLMRCQALRAAGTRPYTPDSNYKFAAVHSGKDWKRKALANEIIKLLSGIEIDLRDLKARATMGL